MALTFPIIGNIQLPKVIRLIPKIDSIEIIPESGIKHAVLFAQNQDINNAILIGKIIEHTVGGELSNCNLWLDVSRPKIILIFGRRGSGKSYDLGLIIEGLTCLNNKIKIGNYSPPIIVFDPLNQFWTLLDNPDKGSVEEKKQIDLLNKWKLEPQSNINVKILVPKGLPKRHPSAEEFSINVSEMNADDWCGFFKVNKYTDTIGQLLSSVYSKVVDDGYYSQGKFIQSNSDYSLQDLIDCIGSDDEINNPGIGFSNQTIRAVVSRLREMNRMPLFQGKKKMDIQSIFSTNQVTLFMLREVDENTRSVIVSLMVRNIMKSRGAGRENEEIANKLLIRANKNDITIEKKNQLKKQAQILLQQAKKEGIPSGWIIIDEAHTLCPSDGYSAAKEILIEYAKQGRAMGLSLAAATQQPSALSKSLISQRDLLFVHHLGIKSDIDSAISQMNPNFPSAILNTRGTITDNIPYRLLNQLNRGESIVSCDESSRNFIVKMRPRVSSHGGQEPIFI